MPQAPPRPIYYSWQTNATDTSWDVSPRNFIITAGIAVCFWVALFVTLWRMRAGIMIVPEGKRALKR